MSGNKDIYTIFRDMLTVPEGVEHMDHINMARIVSGVLSTCKYLPPIAPSQQPDAPSEQPGDSPKRRTTFTPVQEDAQPAPKVGFSITRRPTPARTPTEMLERAIAHAYTGRNHSIPSLVYGEETPEETPSNNSPHSDRDLQLVTEHLKRELTPFLFSPIMRHNPERTLEAFATAAATISREFSFDAPTMQGEIPGVVRYALYENVDASYPYREGYIKLTLDDALTRIGVKPSTSQYFRAGGV